MLDRLNELTSDFGRAEWHVLGALASERKLPQSAVERALRETSAAQGPTGAWLATNLRQGLLADAGEARLPLTARRSEPERGLTVTPELRAPVLRRLAERNELEPVRRLAQTLAGEHSLSAFVTALYAGDVAAVELALPGLRTRFVGGEHATFAREALREAVCSGFDAIAFERTWGSLAPRVAEQVLRDALLTLDPVEPAYAWALSRAASARDAPVAAVCEHALLRGDHAAVLVLEAGAAGTEATSRAAAASYVRGDLARAEQLLNESVASPAERELPLTASPSVSALLALIALARGSSDGLALARRIVRRSVDAVDVLSRNWPAVASVAASNRAVRTLIRQLGKPEAERTRFDAHQLPAQAPAWETLLLALTTCLHEESPVKRTAWARRLRTDGKRWEASYPWFSRQAFGLATALRDPKLDPLGDLPAPRPGELLIVDLIQPRPEWRKSLEALAAFAKVAERTASSVSRRVAWFVDMTRGELSKPALEEYRDGTGWVRGRRLEAAELWARRAELPPEDVAVLIAARDGDGVPELGLEALAALAGHPRVFDGARGRKPIEVTHGTCRIETRHEHGHVIVAVEPRGAVEGINVVLEEETRVVVYRVSAQMAKLTTLLPAGMRIPERHEQEALAVLARLSEHVEIRTDRLGAQRSVAADSTPCLRISPEAGAFWVEGGVRPFGSAGRFFQPGAGRAAVTAHIGEGLLDSVRDLDEERRRFAELVERCPTLIVATTASTDAEEVSEPAPVFSFALSEDSILELLMELRESELPCELEWKSGQRLSLRGRLTRASLHGSLRPVKGWYLVQGSIRIDDVTELALSELVEMPFTKSGRFLRLPSGDYVQVEQRVRQLLTALRACSQPGGPGGLRVPRSAFETLRTLTQNSGFDIDATATAWLALVDSVELTPPPLPDGLKATLRPYQVDGFRWLARASELGLGVCLADDMGLGKTLQVLALLLARAAGGPALVVAPTSVCSNWIDEIARFAPELPAVEYVGKTRAAALAELENAERPGVLVVSYALLQQDAEELGAVEWHTVVLDEAQFIKNPTSLRAQAAFQLRARHRVAMTGTPIENHLGDLWSIFHFLNEQLLGPWKQFQLRYGRPIERDQDAEQKAALRSLVRPFVLRRRKDEVLADLPPVTTVRHEVRLSHDEAVRYAVLRRQIHEKLRTSHGKRQHKLQIFAEITRLRRFCCHPRLVFPEASTESSKVETFLTLVEELRENAHRALVFSQFVDFLDIVREQLEERGIRYLHLDGSTPREARRTRVAAFQAGEADLFLISLKAGGFGLNLTAADYVIHLDPWWNPAVEAQATDRAHRIGQDRPVTVYRLITKDTIEERIVELHAEKRLLADAVLDGSGDAPARLDIEALRELIGPVSFRD